MEEPGAAGGGVRRVFDCSSCLIFSWREERGGAGSFCRERESRRRERREKEGDGGWCSSWFSLTLVRSRLTFLRKRKE